MKTVCASTSMAVLPLARIFIFSAKKSRGSFFLSGHFVSFSSVNGSDKNHLYLIQVLIVVIKRYVTSHLSGNRSWSAIILLMSPKK